MVCLSKPNSVSQIFSSQLTYKRVHDPEAVRVEDKVNTSDDIGHFVQI